MFIHYNFKLFLRLVLLKIYIHSSFSWILKHQSNLNCPSHFFSTNIFYLSFFFFCMIMNENYGWQQGVTLLTPFFFCVLVYSSLHFLSFCVLWMFYISLMFCVMLIGSYLLSGGWMRAMGYWGWIFGLGKWTGRGSKGIKNNWTRHYKR